jgi:hypothetical protein
MYQRWYQSLILYSCDIILGVWSRKRDEVCLIYVCFTFLLQGQSRKTLERLYEALQPDGDILWFRLGFSVVFRNSTSYHISRSLHIIVLRSFASYAFITFEFCSHIILILLGSLYRCHQLLPINFTVISSNVTQWLKLVFFAPCIVHGVVSKFPDWIFRDRTECSYQTSR